MTDFWPKGITLEDAQSPKEILTGAQEQWRTHSAGVLALAIQEATSAKGHSLLVVHAKHEPSNRTAKLFTVIHRKTAPYPVTIEAREDELPDFLRKSYFSPGFGAGFFIKGMEGQTVENEWVADSPGEFRDRLSNAFNLGTVKANILALVASGEDSTQDAGRPSQATGESTDGTGGSKDNS